MHVNMQALAPCHQYAYVKRIGKPERLGLEGLNWNGSHTVGALVKPVLQLSSNLGIHCPGPILLWASSTLELLVGKGGTHAQLPQIDG